MLSAAEGHEDDCDGEDQADDHAPTPKEEYPAFFEQASQVEVAAQKGVQEPVERPDQQQQQQAVGGDLLERDPGDVLPGGAECDGDPQQNQSADQAGDKELPRHAILQDLAK